MNGIKFRQVLLDKGGKFLGFHYWGFMSDGEFVGPETSSSSVSGALKNSKPYIGIRDWKDKEIYKGDIVEKAGIGKGIVVFGEYIIGNDSWGLPIITQGFAIEWDDKSGYCELNKATSVEIVGNIHELELKEIKDGS